MSTVENKSCVLIFSYLFTGENGKKSYETCLSIIQEQEEEKNWKMAVFMLETLKSSETTLTSNIKTVNKADDFNVSDVRWDVVN